MPALISKQDVIDGVGEQIRWVIAQRMKKLRKKGHETMSVSPFLIPILFDLHQSKSFAELGELVLAGHLMTGYTTSFGKLIDEKILPNVFKTTKLSKKFRGSNAPFKEACFDEIDHLVEHPNKEPVLLSVKASRWSIQLTMAVQINKSFHDILTRYPDRFSEIVVGVFYGTRVRLTDKYDILRGINRGQAHDVVDIQNQVSVLAGKEFWSWVNGDEPDTQHWVLDGIIQGLKEANSSEEYRRLLTNYETEFNRKYECHINADGTVNWHGLLADING
jgi:hypothetical protein